MRTKKLSLVVVPLLLTACSQQNVLQQDVYNNQYSCQQDWPLDLCEQESTEYSNGWGGRVLYTGPQYYKTIRKVRYLGNIVKASGRHSHQKPIISTNIRPNAKSTPIRGGFGYVNTTSSSAGG